MRVTYNQEADTMTVTLRDERIKESDEVRPGVVADFRTMAASPVLKFLRRPKSSRTRAGCSSRLGSSGARPERFGASV